MLSRCNAAPYAQRFTWNVSAAAQAAAAYSAYPQSARYAANAAPSAPVAATANIVLVPRAICFARQQYRSGAATVNSCCPTAGCRSNNQIRQRAAVPAAYYPQQSVSYILIQPPSPESPILQPCDTMPSWQLSLLDLLWQHAGAARSVSSRISHGILPYTYIQPASYSLPTATCSNQSRLAAKPSIVQPQQAATKPDSGPGRTS